MLNLIIKIYTRLSDFEYRRIDLYIIALESMRFWTDQQLLENNYFNQIQEIDFLEIYKKKQISNSEIERILYLYYDNMDVDIFPKTYKAREKRKCIGKK